MASQLDRELRARFSTSTWIVMGVLAVVVFLVVAVRSTSDVRTLLLICAGLFVIERTVGDWLADRLGDTFGKMAFLATIGAVSWVLFGTEQGRSVLGDVLALAGREAQQAPASVVSVPASTRPASSTSSARSGSPRVPASPTASQVGNAGSPGEGHAAAAGTAGAQPSASVLATRTTLRASVSPDGRTVALEAVVSAAGTAVKSGDVQFSVDGRALTTIPVNSEGVAETTVTSLPSGIVKVTARYVGTNRFRESAGTTYVSR
jgi:hypothetical protein